MSGGGVPTAGAAAWGSPKHAAGAGVGAGTATSQQKPPAAQPQSQPAAHPAKPNYTSVIGDRTDRGLNKQHGTFTLQAAQYFHTFPQFHIKFL